MLAKSPGILSAMPGIDNNPVNLVLRIGWHDENDDQQKDTENINQLFHLID
jgi:hypothetical protein